jgi:hypothetical protein
VKFARPTHIPGQSNMNAKIIITTTVHPVIKMREKLRKAPRLLGLDSTIFPNEGRYSISMQEYQNPTQNSLLQSSTLESSLKLVHPAKRKSA